MLEHSAAVEWVRHEHVVARTCNAPTAADACGERQRSLLPVNNLRVDTMSSSAATANNSICLVAGEKYVVLREDLQCVGGHQEFKWRGRWRAVKNNKGAVASANPAAALLL